jgi:uncharacterized CHY-type Zn-finger protein
LRVHSGEKWYACVHCDTRFTEKGKLTVHLRVHSEQKAYVCECCDIRFTEKSKLMYSAPAGAQWR